MKLATRLALAAAVVVASAPGYVTAAVAAPPSLAGTTVVTGSRTAGMRVRLPKTTTLVIAQHRHRVTGDGRAVGVVLTGTAFDDPKRPVYSYLRFGFCSTPGCRARSTNEFGFGFHTQEPEGAPERIVLPRGDYQLYVVADGSPVTVTMKLPGLSGTARLRPTVRNRFGPSSPPVRTQSTPTGSVYGAGKIHDFGGFGGMSVQAIGLRTGVWAAGHVGDCLYAERPKIAEAAFQPTCPGGGGSAGITDGVVSPYSIDRQYYMNAYLRKIPGVLGHGAWYTAAAKVDEVHIPSLQLEFTRIR